MSRRLGRTFSKGSLLVVTLSEVPLFPPASSCDSKGEEKRGEGRLAFKRQGLELELKTRMWTELNSP